MASFKHGLEEHGSLTGKQKQTLISLERSICEGQNVCIHWCIIRYKVIMSKIIRNINMAAKIESFVVVARTEGMMLDSLKESIRGWVHL